MMENDRLELEKAKARRERKTVLQGVISEMKTESSIFDQLVDDIIGDSSKELDAFVQRVERLIGMIRKGTLRRYSEMKLEILALELPTLMYRLNDSVEDLAGKVSVASSYRKTNFDKSFLRQSGTIQDKQNAATLEVADYILAEKLIERSRAKLKSKLERALDLFAAIKKIMDSRKVALEVWRRESPMFDNIDPGEMASDDAE